MESIHETASVHTVSDVMGTRQLYPADVFAARGHAPGPWPGLQERGHAGLIN